MCSSDLERVNGGLNSSRVAGSVEALALFARSLRGARVHSPSDLTCLDRRLSKSELKLICRIF